MKKIEKIMKIYIKNMVAQGTRKFVLMELKKLGLKLTSFEAGELEFEDELSPAQTTSLEKSLGKYGLEIISENALLEMEKVEDFGGMLVMAEVSRTS